MAQQPPPVPPGLPPPVPPWKRTLERIVEYLIRTFAPSLAEEMERLEHIGTRLQISQVNQSAREIIRHLRIRYPDVRQAQLIADELERAANRLVTERPTLKGISEATRTIARQLSRLLRLELPTAWLPAAVRDLRRMANGLREWARSIVTAVFKTQRVMRLGPAITPPISIALMPPHKGWLPWRYIHPCMWADKAGGLDELFAMTLDEWLSYFSTKVNVEATNAQLNAVNAAQDIFAEVVKAADTWLKRVSYRLTKMAERAKERTPEKTPAIDEWLMNAIQGAIDARGRFVAAWLESLRATMRTAMRMIGEWENKWQRQLTDMADDYRREARTLYERCDVTEWVTMNMNPIRERCPRPTPTLRPGEPGEPEYTPPPKPDP